MILHDFLKQRKELAKTFTEKNFSNRVKDDLKHYKADDIYNPDNLNIDLEEATNRRYRFVIPLIFTNHESMMASMFDRIPELIFFNGGAEDEEKKIKVEAAYEYLKDKLDLESFMNDAAWWFLLSGFTSAHAGYLKKTKDIPMLDENGEARVDEDGNPMLMNDYEYDDPTIEVGDPFKTFFSPESEFSYSGDKVPYYLKQELLEVSEIERNYGKKVEADATLETDSKSGEKYTSVKSDLARVKTYFYYGTLSKEALLDGSDDTDEIEDWNPDRMFFCVFTEDELLHVESENMKKCRLLKWHGAPNEFFGFGIAKLLLPFQKEKSIRRGQQVRFADVAAFPKLLLDDQGTWDKNALRDPREQIVLTYDKEHNKPEYLAAPNLGQAVADAHNQADIDAQQTSGMIDLGQGSQSSSTVKTATGQTIFADAAEKRMRLAKKKFLKFYREVVILLLKLCQQNWDSEKLINITDKNGVQTPITISQYDLADVDFDTDVDIDSESVSINKDILRQQAIEIYDRVKDDPFVDRKEVFKDMVAKGFNIKDPQRLLKDPVAEPGTQLVNPQTGQVFIVDESGELVDQQAMEQTRQPQGQPGEVPSSPSGMMGGIQNVGI